MTRFAMLVSLCVVLAACGGSAEQADTSLTGTTATTEATTATKATTTLTSPTTSEIDSSGSVRDMGIESITLLPAGEGGPHPTLSWDPITGAETYWLFLRDGSGQIYWAWSGTATSVRVGGGTSPDLNQTAALYEEMSWSVFAFDDTGILLALSDVAEASP